MDNERLSLREIASVIYISTKQLHNYFAQIAHSWSRKNLCDIFQERL